MQPEFAHYGPLLPEMQFQFRRWTRHISSLTMNSPSRLANYANMHREFMAAHALAGKLLHGKDEAQRMPFSAGYIVVALH